MDWQKIDEKLIRRGELILDTDLLEHHEEELKAVNRGKNGRPYRMAASYIQLLSAVRYLYQMPYRRLEGYTRTLHKLVPALPTGDYSGYASSAYPSTPTGASGRRTSPSASPSTPPA